MTGEPLQRELEHDLGRSERPALCALGILQSAQMAAHVDENAGELGADRGQGAVHPLTCRHRIVGEVRGAAGGSARAAVRSADGGPALRDARHELAESIVGAQPLAGLELGGADHRPAVLVLAPPQPRQRTFQRIDGRQLRGGGAVRSGTSMRLS